MQSAAHVHFRTAFIAVVLPARKDRRERLAGPLGVSGPAGGQDTGAAIRAAAKQLPPVTPLAADRLLSTRSRGAEAAESQAQSAIINCTSLLVEESSHR
jgi:hypothetical protein